MKVELDEEDLILAADHVDRMQAIAETLTAIDRNGFTDQLFKHTLLHLMETIYSEGDAAKALLARAE